jgi:hypothetical protein
LGVHISKMRSITLDTILPEEAQFLLNMSNDVANRWWEASLSPNERASVHQDTSFISQKYEHQRWCLKDNSIPAPSRDNVPHSHPWWQTASASESSKHQAAEPSNAVAPAVESSERTSERPPFPLAQPSGLANVSMIDAGVNLIDLGGSPKAEHLSSNEPDPFTSRDASQAASLANTAMDPFAAQMAELNAQSQAPPSASPNEAISSACAADPFAASSASTNFYSSQSASINGAAHTWNSTFQVRSRSYLCTPSVSDSFWLLWYRSPRNHFRYPGLKMSPSPLATLLEQ